MAIVQACEKDSKDSVVPNIESFDLTDSVFQPGDIVEINVRCSDNDMISQLRLRIREAFDKSNFGFWRILRINDFNSPLVNYNYAFTVPDSARAGFYAVSLQASDFEGNGSIDSVRYITVVQPGGPQLTDFETTPQTVDGTLFLSAQDSILFSGTASDDIRIASVRITVQGSRGNSLASFNQNLTDSISFYDFSLRADTLRPPYTSSNNNTPEQLVLKITDSDGNLLRKSYPIIFSP